MQSIRHRNRETTKQTIIDYLEDPSKAMTSSFERYFLHFFSPHVFDQFKEYLACQASALEKSRRREEENQDDEEQDESKAREEEDEEEEEIVQLPEVVAEFIGKEKVIRGVYIPTSLPVLRRHDAVVAEDPETASERILKAFADDLRACIRDIANEASLAFLLSLSK